MAQKIVITGAPGTGKTSIIENLKQKGYHCLEEISRQITLNARKDGIDQLFLEKPSVFSDKLFEGRLGQFHVANAHEEKIVFLDRGIPDILAYMDFINEDYPAGYIEDCKTFKYEYAFVLEPWEDIFKSDSERYENFNEAQEIHKHLVDTYQRFDYELLKIPFGSVEERTNFVLNTINS